MCFNAMGVIAGVLSGVAWGLAPGLFRNYGAENLKHRVTK